MFNSRLLSRIFNDNVLFIGFYHTYFPFELNELNLSMIGEFMIAKTRYTSIVSYFFSNIAEKTRFMSRISNEAFFLHLCSLLACHSLNIHKNSV